MELEKLASIFEACRVLPLRPSDMLVFRTPHNLNVEQMAQVHSYLEGETGHSRILILVDGAELAVLRPEEAPMDAEDLRRVHEALEETSLALSAGSHPQHRPIAPGAGSPKVRADG